MVKIRKRYEIWFLKTETVFYNYTIMCILPIAILLTTYLKHTNPFLLYTWSIFKPSPDGIHVCNSKCQK